MSTLIVIPARLGATRLPQKPLRLLGGRPLIVRVWERVTDMRVAQRVVVATDSDEVAMVARAAGADVVLTRADHQSGTDRVAEVASRAEFVTHDVVVNVQGDEPYLRADVVRAAATLVEQGRFAVGTAACPASAEILGDPTAVKVVTDTQGRALYFSRAPIPWLRDAADRAQRDAIVRLHLGVYAYTREALLRWVSLPPHPLEIVERLEQLRALAAGIDIGVGTVAALPQGGIDTEEDLASANARWSAMNPTASGAH